MDREHVIATLREHEAELKNAGIVHLFLFGSIARGEAGPESDALKSVRLFHLGLSVFIRGLIWNTEGA